ncbi:unnamed protein product [Musa acuminata subsp. burmannicoides]
MDAWKPKEDRGGDRELKPTPPLASSSSSCSKRSRLPVQKRVVSVTVGSKPLHAGEAFPPSDSWSWRKYGQKPIKGSPYPRSYYRCSSCKGCPARKQVECSRLDPTKLIVTYSFDHNHLCPLPRNGHHHQNRLPPPAPPPIMEPAPPAQSGFRPLESTPEQEAKFPVVIGKNEPLQLVDGGRLPWFSDVASASTTSAGSDELLYGSLHFGSDAATGSMAEEREAGLGEESLFAGLGELPEYSVVLRWGLTSGHTG